MGIGRGWILSWCAAAPAIAQSLAGLWDASVVVGGRDIPFRMELSGSGPAIEGAFFNGGERVASTSGHFENDLLLLHFDYYAGILKATFHEGLLTGSYARPSGTYAFQAKRFLPVMLPSTPCPNIEGLWEVAVQSSKGESAWRLIVRQSGAEVTGAVLRVDGDTGELSGAYRDGKFVLSHFSGARPVRLDVTPQKDGTLAIEQNGETMIGRRAADARAQGLPQPTDPSRHTSIKDPSERFHFAFPDLAGQTVSDTDVRFRNKVVIVAIGGSWCPNCHDEAPFLMEVYRKYRGRGLEIVGISFEDGDQLAEPTRLRAFIKRYGIEYPMLLAGETGQLNEKIPQAVNLNSWPTSFFLGRDGKVRSVHAGFADRASGAFHDQLKQEVTSLIERLLAEGN